MLLPNVALVCVCVLIFYFTSNLYLFCSSPTNAFEGGTSPVDMDRGGGERGELVRIAAQRCTVSTVQQ